MTRITKARDTECQTCSGLGYTADTADTMETRRDREYGIVEKKTLSKGSGCPRCLGTGQIVAPPVRANGSGRMHARRIL